MKTTMENMQTLMENLRQIYTDVRLLDADTVNAIREGAYTSSSLDVCYACNHKHHYAHCCAAKQALASKRQRCRVETCGTDILHITATYYEIEGKPYILEVVQRSACQDTLDAETGEHIISEVSGYNTKLYRDAVTGVYNRRYYEDVARKTAGPSCVAVMDLDNFKICNDTYGHRAGDLALESAASAIRSCVRESDTLIRYGGDEFLLILDEIPADYLQVVLERIRSCVQATSIPGFPHLHLTLSVGSVMQTPDEPLDVAVQRADRLMYQAKTRKNIVVFAALNEEEPDSGNEPAPLKQQILIVDDSAFNRDLLSEILNADYGILEAADGQAGLDMMRLHRGEISLVLLDINMPVMDGYDVLKTMNEDHTIDDLPVIMISSEYSDIAIRKCYELGASDYINRPFDSKVVYRRVVNTLKLYAKQRQLVQLISDQIRAREKSTTMLVNVLSQIVEFRNEESGNHVLHIRMITELLLSRLLETDSDYIITPEKEDDIPLASALHDIGKIAIDEHILNKPGRLTPEEFEIVKTHSMQGANMLHKLPNFKNESLLQTAYEITRWHHERWDGNGYPDGLKGDEIPLSAQLVSIADVYDALTSKRCYKRAFTHSEAMKMILDGECGAFNPLLLQCLVDIQEELRLELDVTP